MNVNCPFVVERLTGEEKPLEMNKNREQLWKMLMEFDYESRNYHRPDNKGRRLLIFLEATFFIAVSGFFCLLHVSLFLP